MFSKIFLIETFLFLIFAVPLSIMDVKKLRISLFYTFLGIAAFFAFRIFYFSAENFFFQLKFCAVSVISAALVLFLTRVFSGGGLGIGDIIFGIFSAVYCVVWWKNLAGLLFAALLGVLFYLFLAVLSKIRKTEFLHPVFAIPFVPFISAGTILARIIFG